MVPATHRPKATLFCPECGHESPADGDWDVRQRGTRDQLACPQCATTVTARPSTAEPLEAVAPTGSNPVARLTRATFAWQRLTLALPAIGSRS